MLNVKTVWIALLATIVNVAAASPHPDSLPPKHSIPFQDFPVRNGITCLEQPTDIALDLYAAAWPHLQPVLRHLQENDSAGAQNDLKTLLEQNANDDGALNLLAQLQRQQSRYDQALETMEKAIQVFPQNHLHYFQLALICYKKREKASFLSKMTWHGRTQKAFIKALDLEPRGAFYRYYAAYTYLNAPAIGGGDKKTGLQLAQEGIDSGLTPFLLIRADALLALDRKDEAFADYDSAMAKRLFKTNAASFTQAFQTAVDRKDMQRAQKYSEYILQCIPEDPRAYEVQGDFFLAMGDTARAVEAYQTALTKNPPYEPASKKLHSLTRRN